MDAPQQELYGGAITMSLPRKFENIWYIQLDLRSPWNFLRTAFLYSTLLCLNNKHPLSLFSNVREVPDHQEVFVNVDEDQSVIVEILELAAEASDEACAT